MKRLLTISWMLLYFLSTSCSNNNRKDFKATALKDDKRNFTLEQTFDSPNKKEFLAIMQGEGEYSFTSGPKVLKLYSQDSISTAEVYFSEHQLEIIKWESSDVYFSAEINSTKKDSAYSVWYLNNSVDQNETIGDLRLHFQKKINVGLE